jgi:hypothetical protein
MNQILAWIRHDTGPLHDLYLASTSGMAILWILAKPRKAVELAGCMGCFYLGESLGGRWGGTIGVLISVTVAFVVEEHRAVKVSPADEPVPVDPALP